MSPIFHHKMSHIFHPKMSHIFQYKMSPNFQYKMSHTELEEKNCKNIFTSEDCELIHYIEMLTISYI